MKKTRQLNPRVCRGCGRVFTPPTSLSRYGAPSCKKLGPRFKSRAVPGAEVTHE